MPPLRSTSLLRNIIGVTLLSGILGQAIADPVVPYSGPEDPVSYWTPERMKNAKPVDEGKPAKPHIPPSVPRPTGPAGAVSGSLPGHTENMGVPPGFLDSEKAIPVQPPMPLNASAPNTTFEYGPSYLQYPISTLGRLFLGSGSWCSAGVVTGARNMLWTAGHCLAGGGTWYGNYLFCPSFNQRQGGVNPALGCWAYLNVRTSREWFSQNAWERDYAMVALQHTGTVIHGDVADVTGTLGFTWNVPRLQNWVHVGYPGNSPFNGGQLIWTGAQYLHSDAPTGIGPPGVGWGSPQGGGSSGSPVILSFNYGGIGSSGGNFVNSDLAWYYPDYRPGQMYGPYFETQVCNFWKDFTGATVTC